jgi:predicted urease superfamily metal-dependent hydrolase
VRVRVTAIARAHKHPPVVPIAATDFAGVECASSTRLINDAIAAQTRCYLVRAAADAARVTHFVAEGDAAGVGEVGGDGGEKMG